MDVPAKGFWRGNKSVVGKVPQEREGYEHCVSDESRKETTKQVSQGEETDRVEKVGRGQEVSKGKQTESPRWKAVSSMSEEHREYFVAE